MKNFTQTIRTLVLLAVLVSTLFAGSAYADNDITASGNRLTNGNGVDKKTVSVQFLGIPAEYEGWNATLPESMPVCGVVTNGVVNCEFRREGAIKGTWLHLYKGTDQVASFYVSFYVPGMKLPKPQEEENCESIEIPTFLCFSQCC
mgnify:CR=1 FL=1